MAFFLSVLLEKTGRQVIGLALSPLLRWLRERESERERQSVCQHSVSGCLHQIALAFTQMGNEQARGGGRGRQEVRRHQRRGEEGELAGERLGGVDEKVDRGRGGVEHGERLRGKTWKMCGGWEGECEEEGEGREQVRSR